MKLFTKLIRPLLIGVGVVLTVNLIHSGHIMWASIIIILVFIALVHDLKERLGNIEANLKSTEDKLKQPLCYKIRLDVSPKWVEILSEHKYSALFEKLFADTELEINKETSLIYKNFKYTIFIDDASGLTQIWSDYHKEFLDNYDISGRIIEIDNFLGNHEKIKERYNIEYGDDLTGWIIFSPSRIGYCHKYLELPTIDKNRILSQIPYESIIESLKKEHICGGNFMTEDLKKKLDENNVQYETWNKDDVVWMFYHIFSTRYYSISINIEFFDKWGE